VLIFRWGCSSLHLSKTAGAVDIDQPYGALELAARSSLGAIRPRPLQSRDMTFAE
jgi:hypothetical protein